MPTRPCVALFTLSHTRWFGVPLSTDLWPMASFTAPSSTATARPVVGMHGGPHGPFMFHGHPFAWHPVHFAHPWVYPQGYGYRLWAVGAILPPLFWQRPDYYYNGWADMGLPPPDPGFQYVQYGPDLLLVNVSTGEVAQVFPGGLLVTPDDRRLPSGGRRTDRATCVTAMIAGDCR